MNTSNDTISLKDVLAYLDGGKPFDIMFITANTKLQTGGEECYINNCRKLMQHTTRMQVKENVSNKYAANRVFKNPNHYKNSTRNLLLENGEIRECHIRLIRLFNNKTVM